MVWCWLARKDSNGRVRPDTGETLIGLGNGYLPPAPLQPGHLVWLGAPFASPSLIAPEFFRADFAADINPKLAGRLSNQQRPTSFGLFFEPAGPVAWHALPSWYAVSGLDRMVDPPFNARWRPGSGPQR
jgi:hypothetical protein